MSNKRFSVDTLILFSFVYFQPHSSWHSQLCGVCSNYNSEPMDDYLGPRREYYSKPEPFLLSYIISEPSCDMQDVRERLLNRISIPILGASSSGMWYTTFCIYIFSRKQYSDEIANMQSCSSQPPRSCIFLLERLSVLSTECRKEWKTIKTERTDKKIPETCFSVEPVPKCEGPCSEPKKIKKSISLHCLPSKDSRTKQLLDKLERGEILDELKREKVNHHKEIPVPEMCLPAGPSVRN